jgi:hypothetical protein
VTARSVALFVAAALAEIGGAYLVWIELRKLDSDKKVVDCSSNGATQKLVTKQSGSTAIACVEIGDKPQKQVQVGDDTFCAEPK